MERNMKPILFNTDMVRAMLDGHKSMTRRVVKPQLISKSHVVFGKDGEIWFWWSGGTKKNKVKPPYRPGDNLYVRETWCKYGKLNDRDQLIEGTEEYYYRADGENPTPFNYFLVQHAGWDEYRENPVWRPSIRMPKEAARLFLRVTDVRVERLQDISAKDIIREGTPDSESSETNRGYFADDIWDSTIKKADLPRYGWAANPWVWVIAFERISKEEALSTDAGA